MFTTEEREEIYHGAQRELASFPKNASTEVNAQQTQEKDKEIAGPVPPPPVPLFSRWADIEDAELDRGLDELEQYLKHKPTMENDRDILSFWKHNQNMFPSMVRLARKILCVPASSVSCESAFSISGRTLENRWTCLSTASVNALLFLNSNMSTWKWKQPYYTSKHHVITHSFFFFFCTDCIFNI